MSSPFVARSFENITEKEAFALRLKLCRFIDKIRLHMAHVHQTASRSCDTLRAFDRCAIETGHSPSKTHRGSFRFMSRSSSRCNFTWCAISCEDMLQVLICLNSNCRFRSKFLLSVPGCKIRAGVLMIERPDRILGNRQSNDKPIIYFSD
jgi:hypothetical protein